MTDIDIDIDTRDATPEEETMIGEIMRLRTALTASLAREAAAYVAAGEVSAVFVHERLYKANFPACSYHHADIKAAVKALTPADAQAALQAMINAAVKEARDGGMRKAINLINENHCPMVAPPTWSRDEVEGYENGQMDAAKSFIAKIGGAI